MNYEQLTMNSESKKQTQSNPIYRGVSSVSRICYVYGSTKSFDSAKMAQYLNNWNLKNTGGKKPNLLKCKGLNKPHRLRPTTGTLFARLNRWNFLFTYYTQ